VDDRDAACRFHFSMTATTVTTVCARYLLSASSDNKKTTLYFSAACRRRSSCFVNATYTLAVLTEQSLTIISLIISHRSQITSTYTAVQDCTAIPLSLPYRTLGHDTALAVLKNIKSRVKNSHVLCRRYNGEQLSG